MRRLFRWAFNGAAAVSLLLCVATCVLWVRSYWRVDNFGWDVAGGHRQISSDRGEIDYFRMSPALAGEFSTGYTGWERPAGEPPTPRVGRTFLGFRTYADPVPRLTEQIIGVPYWFASSATAIPVMALLLKRLLRRPPLPGHCPCGYDLRATPDRCPECGAVPAVTAKP